MKNLKKYTIVLSLLTFGVLFFNNCSKENEKSTEENAAISFDKSTEFLAEGVTIVIQTPYTFSDLFTFPIGTELTIKGHDLLYKLPDGFVLIMKLQKKDGSFEVFKQTGNGTCTCTCLEGKGCSPGVMNGNCACVMSDGCSLCRKGSISRNGEQLEIIEAQMLNFNTERSFISITDDYSTLVSPKPFIFENPEVKSMLENFLGRFNSEEDGLTQKDMSFDEVSDQYAMVPVNFLGTLVIAAINNNSFFNINLIAKSIYPEIENYYPQVKSYSCNCDSGGNGCIKRPLNFKTGTLYYCDAGECRTCTLNY
jgi:hypothetical protein